MLKTLFNPDSSGKKISLVLIVLVGFTSAVLADEWVNFNDRGVTAPIYEITNSTSSLVEFELEIPGMNSKDIDNFNRVFIPEHTTMNSVGFPEIPVVSFLVAIPECDNVNLNVTLLDSIVIDNMNIYPSPELVEVQNGDITYLEEQFSINDAAYNTEEYFPDYTYELVEKGAVRSQHCIRVKIYPVQFNPVQEKIKAYSRVNIEMTFENATGSVNEDVGIFNEVCGAAMVNYNSNGLNASVSCGAGNQDQGQVQWVENFADCPDGKYIAENCDYLIISHEEFWENPDLQNLADKRANYNGFDVVIVKTIDIQNQVNQTYLYDKIKVLIKNTYNQERAEHTYDGKLGYVNLFSDVTLESGAPYPVPTYQEGYDIYFSQLTIGLDGNPDVYPDILLGRCSVDSEEQVANVCQKIIDYEPINIGAPGYDEWKDRMTFLAGQPEWGLQWPLGIIDPLVTGYETTLLTTPDYLFPYLNFDHIIPNNSEDNLLGQYEEGNLILTYMGHGGDDCWAWTAPSYQHWFYYEDDIGNPQYTQYDNRLPLIFSMSCLTGAFQNNDNCLAEQFLSESSIRGAIGFIGASHEIHVGGWQTFLSYLFKSTFQHSLGMCGEMLLEAKLNTFKRVRNCFNLFGDPALNILLDIVNINECDLLCNRQEIDVTTIENQTLHVVAGICNRSEVDITDNFEVECYLTNEFLNTTEYSNVTISGIGPMGVEAASFNFNVRNYMPGEYEVRIVVDALDEIQERNEENNVTEIIYDFYRFQDGFPVLYSHSQVVIPNVPLVDNGCVIIGNKKLSSDGDQIWENDLETCGLPLPICDNDNNRTDYIFLNIGRNKFYKVNGINGNYVMIYSDPGNIYNYCLGDVNNDGELELICNAQCDNIPITDQRLKVIVLSNNYNSFELGIDYCESVNDIAIGDSDNDGKNEIYVLDATNEQLKRYEFNNNEITLTDYKQLDCTPKKIILEDFNMDGNLDCFIGCKFNLYLIDCFPEGFATIDELLLENRSLYATTVGDVYNDGNTEIIAIESEIGSGGDSEIYLISINGNQLSQELLFSIEDANFIDIVTCDLNADRQLDFIIYGYCAISGYTTQGNKLFQVPKSGCIPIICDIDNDGDIELIFGQNASNYDNKRKLIVSDLTIDTSNHGNIYPKMNKYNNNLYCQPVSGSLSEETTYHWNGTYRLHNDVILPENSVLYIMPGSVIKAQQGNNLSILGSLTAKGAENYPIKFIPNIYSAQVDYWNGIEFIGESISSLIYCQIENAETGIYSLYHSLGVYSCLFEQNSIGISLEGYNGTKILNNTITNNSIGIELLDSSPWLKENNITNNQSIGIFVGANSFPIMEYGTNNLVSGNGDFEIYMIWGHPLLFNGHNDLIHESDGYILAVYRDFGTGAKSIPVEHNWWGNYPPEEEKFYPQLNGWFQWNPADEEPNCTQDEEKSESKMAFDNANQLEENGDYSAALQAYKSLIDQYPDSDEAEISLSRIFSCEKHLDLPDFEELTSYYDSLSNNAGEDTLFAIFSRNLAIECKIHQEIYDVALNDYGTILMSYPILTDSVFTVINIMRTLMLADTCGGKNLLNVPSKILEMKPKDMLEYSLKKKELLRKIGYPLLEDQENTQEVPDMVFLYQNYPNPLSVSTTISFSLLPNTQKAELKIYNIRGQLVRKLDIDNKSGIGSISWDGLDSYGKKVGSGIYFYKLTSDKKEIVKKMVLMR